MIFVCFGFEIIPHKHAPVMHDEELAKHEEFNLLADIDNDIGPVRNIKNFLE